MTGGLVYLAAIVAGHSGQRPVLLAFLIVSIACICLYAVPRS